MEEMPKDMVVPGPLSFPDKPTAKVEELRKKAVPHGKLVSCSYSSYSSGMMANSNSSFTLSVRLEDARQIITDKMKPAFEGTTIRRFEAAGDVLSEIQSLVEREGLAALSELKKMELFQCTDYSSSESIDLVFDDRELGGGPAVTVFIDAEALSQNGAGYMTEELTRMISSAAGRGRLLEEQKLPAANGMMMGMMMGMTAPPSWTCPGCGTGGNTGMFCPECGRKKDT